MEPLRKNAAGFLLCKKLCKTIKNWGNCQRKKDTIECFSVKKRINPWRIY